MGMVRRSNLDAGVGLMLMVGWPSAGMASRKLNCAQQADPRARQLCIALQEHMEWTWFGHAIVSPGARRQLS